MAFHPGAAVGARASIRWVCAEGTGRRQHVERSCAQVVVIARRSRLAQAVETHSGAGHEATETEQNSDVTLGLHEFVHRIRELQQTLPERGGAGNMFFEDWLGDAVGLVKHRAFAANGGVCSVALLQLLTKFASVSDSHSDMVRSWLTVSDFVPLWRSRFASTGEDDFIHGIAQCSSGVLLRHLAYFSLCGVSPGVDYVHQCVERLASSGAFATMRVDALVQFVVSVARLEYRPQKSVLAAWQAALTQADSSVHIPDGSTSDASLRLSVDSTADSPSNASIISVTQLCQIWWALAVLFGGNGRRDSDLERVSSDDDEDLMVQPTKLTRTIGSKFRDSHSISLSDSLVDALWDLWLNSDESSGSADGGTLTPMTRASVQELTTILWASATLKSAPPASFHDALSNCFNCAAPNLSASVLVDVMWAYGELNLPPPENISRKWMSAFQHKARELSCEDLIVVLQAAARLRLDAPQEQFFNSAVSAFRLQLLKWTAGQLAAFVDALSILKYEPERALMTQWFDRFEMAHFEMSASELATSIVAVARLGVAPSEGFLARWGDSFESQQELFTAEDLALCFWALARIGVLFQKLPRDEITGREFIRRERWLQNRADEHFTEREEGTMFGRTRELEQDPAVRRIRENRNIARELPGHRSTDEVLLLLDEFETNRERFTEVSREANEYFLERWLANDNLEMSQLSASQLANVLWAFEEHAKCGNLVDWDFEAQRNRAREVWLESLGPRLADASPGTLKVVITALEGLGWEEAVNPILNQVEIAVSVLREQLEQKQAMDDERAAGINSVLPSFLNFVKTGKQAYHSDDEELIDAAFIKLRRQE